MKPPWTKRMRPFAVGLVLGAVFNWLIGVPPAVVFFAAVATASILASLDAWVWRDS